MSFFAKYAGLHIDKVVLTALLECGIIALLLKLLCFQKVAWVIFIRYAQRHDVQLLQSVEWCALAAHGHHFEYRLLCAVIRVLGTSLALCNPNALMFLFDGKVHVFTHALARHEHFAHTHRALHNERLVQTHEGLYPRVNKQVVAYGYFDAVAELVVDKQDV